MIIDHSFSEWHQLFQIFPVTAKFLSRRIHCRKSGHFEACRRFEDLVAGSEIGSGTYGSNITVKQYLVEEFGEHIIGYGNFQEWPPRSPDLTPMDFFLCGYLKQQMYATPPSTTLQDLQRHVAHACANVTSAMQHRVQRDIQARIQMCVVADGEKFEH
ncbi:hypothetical protein AVEN_124065-1 [Araneus ventricosus]|uniref:Uncharacterized protein n=1 Tax=Araneus ventricosus TaxID=182803 RepID=A0A4Y2QF80_ARAVE|nr:hypothetical protein AVEN_124065-1 [Araneus ventricosus]